METETRVGFMTTSILEGICREAIVSAGIRNDYDAFDEYIAKYMALHDYNNIYDNNPHKAEIDFESRGGGCG